MARGRGTTPSSFLFRISSPLLNEIRNYEDTMKEKGFSLVELLVVVIIIAIIAAIAIPSLLASRRAANEASAIESLRAIHGAETTYFATNGANTNYTNMATLSGTGLLDPTFTGASFVKSGYTISQSVPGSPTAYCADAIPVSAQSGTRRFGIDQNGVLLQGLTAATPCDTGLLDTTGGAPIQ